jgi:hypothetical protein
LVKRQEINILIRKLIFKERQISFSVLSQFGWKIVLLTVLSVVWIAGLQSVSE